MKVRDVMKKEIKTISREATAREAYKIMEEGEFRHLPVVDGNKLAGIISDRDLRVVMRVAEVSEEKPGVDHIPEHIKVSEIMTVDPAILVPETDLRQAVELMSRHKIGALPVVEGGDLVGILTQSDMLKLLIEFLE